MASTNKQFLVRTGVNLPAGNASSTVAPLTFQAGVNMSTPVNGSVEWDGYNLFLTELNSNATSSTSPAVITRRTLAYTDSTMLPNTLSIAASGAIQSNATITKSDIVVITATTNGYGFTSTASSIAGSTLTIGGTLTGTVVVGQFIIGIGVTSGAYISANISGSGIGSTWTLVGHSGTVASTGISSPYSGVKLPPPIAGRCVVIVNSSAAPIRIFPYPALANLTINATSVDTTIYVSSTTGLYPGMRVEANSGTGVFQTATSVTSILSSTSFSVNKVPSTPFINGDTIRQSTATNGTTTINTLSANNAFTMTAGSTVSFTAISNTGWYTSSTSPAGSNNGINGDIYSVGDLFYSLDVNGTVAGLNDTAIGQVLLSKGVGVAPAYGTIDLSTSIVGNSILSIANGGTGTNGSGLNSAVTTYNLLTSVATTINMGTLATSISIGASSGTTTVNNNLTVTGNLTVNGTYETSNSTTTAYLDPVLELHKPSAGWIISDDGKDIGLKYHNYKTGSLFVVTNSLFNTPTSGLATITLSDGIIIPVGTIISVGSTLSTFASAPVRVTASIAGSVTFASAAVANSAAIGTIQVVNSISSASGSSNGTTLTITYTGTYSLTNGDKVTLTGLLPSTYNGTWTIAVASAGSFTITAVSLDTPSKSIPVAGSTTQAGTIVLNDRFAFSGWANDSSSFEFYKEGYENSSSNTFTGAYGTIKSGSLLVSASSSLLTADFQAGVGIKIPAANIFNIGTANPSVTGAAIVKIAQQTVNSVNTIVYTDMSSLYIANAPVATGNTTITNAYALNVAAGQSLFGGNILANSGTISTSQTTFNLINTNATTLSIGGAATSIAIGNTSGTTTINNASLALPNASINFGTTTPTIVSSTNGAASVFNTNTLSGSLFGAATSVSIGAATGTMTLGNSTITATNATVFNMNGASPSIVTTSTATGSIFNTNITAGQMFGAAATIKMGITSIVGTVVTIGNTTAGQTNSIIFGAGATSIATIDTGNSTATVNLFPSMTSSTFAIGAAAQAVTIGGSTVASAITLGGAVSGSTVTLKASAAGTLNLSTDVTTGIINVFAGVQAQSAITSSGTIVIGGTTLGTTAGIVKLGASPSQTAIGNEVVTANWVINNVGSINSVTTDVGTLTTSQIIDNTQTTPGIFSFGAYRSSKYLIQVTQIGQTATRTQTSEMLITHDAPFITFTSATATASSTILTANTYGLYLGMTIVLYTAVGSDTIAGGSAVITAITHGVSITIGTTLATISAGSVLKGYLNGAFVTTTSTQSVAANTSINLSIFTFTSSTNGIYPGMSISGNGVTAGTYVTEVTTTTFKLNQSIANNTSWLGTPNLFITEYGVLETAGTVAVYNATINTSSPYNIQLTATATYASVGTAVKTIYKLEKELLELY